MSKAAELLSSTITTEGLFFSLDHSHFRESRKCAYELLYCQVTDDQKSRQMDLSRRHCILGFVIIVVSCFILGFLLEVVYLNFHHDSQRIPSGLRARIDVQKSDALSQSQLSNDELDRLLRLDELYTAQLRELQQLKSQMTSGKADTALLPFLNNNLITGSSMQAPSSSTLDRDGIYNVPNVVKAWRNAKLDWHQMLPKHLSSWERFGWPDQGKGLRLLVSKEVQATDFLTRFQESGLAAKYGHDHGPLLSYSGCEVFSSSCMVHDAASCAKDQLCSWSTSELLCIDRTERGAKPAQCLNPKKIGDEGFRKVQDDACLYYVEEPAIIVSTDSESQSMFYHWWASWSMVHQYWKGKLNGNRNAHFIMKEINEPMFFQYFGLLSDNCWRRSSTRSKHIPEGACFCDAHDLFATQSRTDPLAASKQMLAYLGLSEVTPPKDKVKVGIISRRRKRFILNEYELVEEVQKMGFECVLLPLETMTMYEQMYELRSLDVLIGLHGSALDNSVFLHPGSVMVQLLPYKVEHRCTFQSSAEGAGVKYMEWQLQDRSKAYFHWDLLDQANAEKLKTMSKETILQQGQVAADNRETLMFWINQDIIVPIEEWKPLVLRAVASSLAKSRGININPKKL